jgi:ketosteroid isomerase-like protein
MGRIVGIVLVAAFAAGPVMASDKTDVMAVVHQWIDSFSKGDAKTAIAACAGEGAILDDIPPHEWHGAGMCSRWMSDYDSWASKNGMTDGIATPGRARHIDVDGATAYVVLPMTLTWKEHGKPMKETGAVVTMSLAKGDSGWRITGWAWAAGTTAPASADTGH